MKLLCKLMKIGRSGYYAWKKRAPSAHEQEDQAMKSLIKPIFEDSRDSYGSRRITAQLRRVGVSISRRRMSRLMREEGQTARQTKRWHPRTTKADANNEKAPNLLEQEFSAQRPNEKWVVDITYIATQEGWLYLAVILDLFSRIVVGWSMNERMNKELVMDAWKMACAWRKPAARMLHHSDLGSQYTSKGYLDLLREKECLISMSGKGNCYDNAVIESFFSTLKGECADKVFESRAKARNDIFEYIEIWYNRKRLHSTLGYLSPMEFEIRETVSTKV